MAARAAQLGDVGESSPEQLGDSRSARRTCTSRLAALSPTRERLAGRRRAGTPRACGAAGRRGDLAPGLLPAPDRTHVLRLQGRDRPAGGRGQRHARASNPQEPPLKAGEFILGYPDETGELPPMPTPEVLGRNGTYVVFRKLHTKVAAYRQYLRANGRRPRGGGAARREDGRALAERRAARALAGARTIPSSAPTRSATTTSSTATILRGFKCPAGAHARRANPRDALDGDGSVDVRLHRMIRRGTSYGPMLPEGVLEDDGADRGHHLRLRRRAPQAPVRVRQDPVAQRRHLHRRPGREGPAGRAERRVRARSRSRSGRSAAGCRSCRRSSSPAAASTASHPACAALRWLAELELPDRGEETT